MIHLFKMKNSCVFLSYDTKLSDDLIVLLFDVPSFKQ